MIGHKILLGDQIKEDEVGWACGMWHLLENRNTYILLVEKEEGCLDDLGLDGWVIYKNDLKEL